MSTSSLSSLGSDYGAVKPNQSYSPSQMHSLHGQLNTVKQAEYLAQKILPLSPKFADPIIATLKEWEKEPHTQMKLGIVIEWIRENISEPTLHFNDTNQDQLSACKVFFHDQATAALAQIILKSKKSGADNTYQYNDKTGHWEVVGPWETIV